MDAAFEGGLSAVEELKMLKEQVQEVARVCRVRNPLDDENAILILTRILLLGCRRWRPHTEDHHRRRERNHGKP